jgi:NAD(P)-dependent dehydrogenase (short-subunit alcohol dehydrogenase family)
VISDTKIIITGSRGLIGTSVTNYFKQKQYQVIECDLQLGHDLSDEQFVIDFFKDNRANHLINLFALNHHIERDKLWKKSNLFNVSLDSFDIYLHTNLVCLFSVCRQFAKNNSKGCIVNFSSTYGSVSPVPKMYSGDEKHIAYGVSKAGVVQLTKHLATHLAPNIRVNCIAPGGVEADQSDDFKFKYSSRTPLGRMMKSNELNGLLDYMCSDKSSYMTGEIIKVDGGWTIW